MRFGPFSFAVLFSLTGACNGGEATASGFSDPTHPNVTTVAGSSGSSTTGDEGSGFMSTSSSSTSGPADSSSTGALGPKLDMPVPDAPPAGPIGCAGKIDFLFVISTSGTMEHHQQQLASAFPEFMEAIKGGLGEFDVRVLSANPTGWWDMDACSNCANAQDCTYNGKPPTCGAVLDACDTTHGAGVTFPAGTGSANRRCDFYGGNRFIVGDDPNFKQSFACLTQAGMNGAIPLTSEAMVLALSPDFNAPGGCHEGFLRKDALLVVTLFADGYDNFSQGTVDDWIQALRAAKHGDEDAFAVLAFSTDVDAGYGNLCHPFDPDPTPNPLRQLADGVEHGHFASICEPSYVPFFSGLVDEIVTLCESFHIPQ